MFLHRGERVDNGEIFPHEDIPSIDTLERRWAGDERPGSTSVLDDMFYLSGEIPRTTSYEKGIPIHTKRDDLEADWQSDPLLMDERYVAVNLRGKGNMIFTACSHTGRTNILRGARDTFSPTPLYGVMGGFHLAGKLF
jgi:7,8-dihydropterin-6-yl-methyl-4-(beta-D-ribofuranosyl)aminobenzene 5'-phosphate synthase